MIRYLYLSAIAALVFGFFGCSSNQLITEEGGSFIFGYPNDTWYMELPSSNYKVVDFKDALIKPEKGSVVLRNVERKMSVTLTTRPAEGKTIAIQCRDSEIPTKSILIDPESIRTYVRDSAAYVEYNISSATGYSGRYVEAFYLKDDEEFSIVVYISNFNEATDRSLSDAVFSTVKFGRRQAGN